MDLTQICRMCLCVKMDLLSFDDLGNIYQDKNIMEVLNCIFNKKLSMQDNQPKYICDACVMKSVETYIFMIRCLNSYKYITKYIENNATLNSVNSKIKPINSKVSPRFKKNKAKIKCNIKTKSNKLEESSDDEFLGFANGLQENDVVYEDELILKDFNDIKCFMKTEDMKQEEVENIVIIVGEDKSNEGETYDLNTTELLQHINVVEENKEEMEDNKFSVNSKIFGSVEEKCKKYVKEEPIKKKCSISEIELEDLDDSVDIFKCSSCNKSFKNKYILKAHVKRHEQQGQFICTTCGKAFNSQGCLTRHVNIHTGTNRYECEVCHKTFPSSNNLLMHSRIHSGVKPYLCTTCGKAFSHVTSLTYHIRTHTNERPFQCHICGKQFTIQCHFDRHKKTHTGERPFQCDTCGKGFIKKFDLQRHQAIHNSDRPHKCTYCKKTFIRRLTLKLHMMVHTKERPHKCEFCGRGFIRAYYLKDHISKMHLNDDDDKTTT